MNPFVFLVGCARSGTTLLQRIVDSHPQVAILCRETHWIPSYFRERVGLTPEGWVTPALIPRLLEHRTFAKLGIGRGQLEALLGPGRPLPYARFVSGLFDLYGQAQGKPLVGDKTPAYCRELGLLHALWPGARFVHLIRDGRDVCLSVLSWEKVARLASLFTTWAEDAVTTAALWWEWHVRLGRQGGQALPPGLYHELRYEDLVARPEAECARLGAFLGVPYDPAMLRFHEGRTAKKPGRDAKHAWLPIMPGLRDWRAQLPPGDVERFEAAAGSLLDELGYPRGCPHPTPAARGHAARLRGQFDPAVLLLKSALSEP